MNEKSQNIFLYELFPRFGVQEIMVPDNGTQFSSKDFESIFKIHSFVDFTSPPHHPRSNGLVERFIDAFKRAIKKVNGIETVERRITKIIVLISHNI